MRYIRLLRVSQYVKNLFIFLPLFFGLRLFDAQLFIYTFFAFAGFSLVASGVYIMNDIMDIEEDRRHPVKKYRPLAASTVTKKEAFVVMGIALLMGFGILAMLGWTVIWLTAGYFIINILYTFKLKHIPIVDVLVVSIGFIIRLFVGAEAARIPLSLWIVVLGFVLALFLTLGKRREDVIIASSGGEKTRQLVRAYNLDFLNASMVMMGAVVIVSYIMYTISPDIVAKFHSERLYLTVIFVILGILRYTQLVFVGNEGGSPSDILIRDRFLQLTILGWGITLLLILYF